MDLNIAKLFYRGVSARNVQDFNFLLFSSVIGPQSTSEQFNCEQKEYKLQDKKYVKYRFFGFKTQHKNNIKNEDNFCISYISSVYD